MPEILRDAGSYAAAGAFAGILLLLPLFLSQRRDVQRLRSWQALEPERGEPVTGTFATAISASERGGLSALERITSERPALERITAERARFAQGPWWRRFLLRLPEPQHPMWIAAGAFLVGAGIFLGSMQLLDTREDSSNGGAIQRSDAAVAVLNGSDLPGLGGKVADDVRVNGFNLETVTSSPRAFAQTVVMYTPGHELDARRLAKALGVKPVQPIDRASAKLADGADLVVIAGDDRTR